MKLKYISLSSLCFLFITANFQGYSNSPPPFIESLFSLDLKKWEIFKESHENGSDLLELHSKDSLHSETIQFVFEKSSKRKKATNSNALTTLIFPDYEELSSFSKMRELRLHSKYEQNPYSSWKLLYVFDENDIIYACKTPSFGPYSEHYQITRLIKKEEWFISITYQTPLHQDLASETHWLSWLKSLKIS